MFKKFLLKKNLRNNLLLFFILLIGLFLRVYKLEGLYHFAHDQDLYSWIVKDIFIDHHLRSIGQLTSIEGVFIGPLFYYLLIPFFYIFKMDPLGATVFAASLGLFTIFSFYFTFSRLFNKTVGTTAALLYSVSLPNVFFDRWVVPTQPTILWSVWFLFAIFRLSKGDSKSLILLGFLMGLVWHIHIALIPLAILIPLAFIFSKPKIPFKTLLVSFALFFVLTLPFFVFEVRHNFQQVHGFLNSTTLDNDESEGAFRLAMVLDKSSGYLAGNLQNKLAIPPVLTLIFFIILGSFFCKKRILGKRDLSLMGVWVACIILAQLVSKRAVSEYYFANFTVIPILLISLIVAFVWQKPWSRAVVSILASLFVLYNLISFLQTADLRDGYLEKKRVVDYIQNDAKLKNYPCVGVNYVAKFGTDVGFRYLLWLKGIKVVRGGTGVPVYNVVIPWTTSASEINKQFGILGVVLPVEKNIPDKSICDNPDNQLLPLLGFEN